MEYNYLTNISGCIESATQMMGGNFNLLYYSHIPAAIISLIVGIFVILNNRKDFSARVFFVLSIIFSLWLTVNLISWVSSNSLFIMFSWSLLGMLDCLLFLSCLLLVYSFDNNKDLPLRLKYFLTLLALPIFFLTPTNYNLNGFDLTNCTAIDMSFYGYIFYFKFLVTILIIIFGFFKYFKVKDRLDRKKIFLISTGVILFLLSIFGTGYIADTTSNYAVEVYGIFAMTLFMVFITYLIVKFRAFDIKLLGTQALVWGLVITIGSQFFFVETNINKILTGITLFISSIAGIMIVRSVKKEIKQKEKIEELAVNSKMSIDKLADLNFSLKDANEHLRELDMMKSEFVSLATHQIRGPLSAIKGYVSLMIEGDYGKAPATFVEPLDTVFKSTDSLSKMVTDFLDVSRIDLGQMKYEFSDFDFRDLVEEVVKELRPGIELRGLEFREKLANKSCYIHADRTKLKQVLNNLIDNSTKYTPAGWLEVTLEIIPTVHEAKVLFAVKDSGVGISERTMKQLFQRFSRAKDANDVNILGTGLGLYIAKKMVEANHGKIWAESAGEGKGAEFYVELNLVK